MHIFFELTHVLRHFFFAHEFLALFSLITIEEAGVPLPLPGDTLVILAGAHRHPTLGYIALVIGCSTAAVFCGSSVLYYIMRRGGRTLLAKYGKFLHLRQERLARMEGWFARHGPVAIVVGRLIPGLRIPTTVMAGLSGVPYSVYAPTAAVAAVIWSLLYYSIGLLINREQRILTSIITGLLDLASDFAVLLWLVTLGLVVTFGTWHIQRLQRQRQQADSPASKDAPGKADSPDTATASSTPHEVR